MKQVINVVWWIPVYNEKYQIKNIKFDDWIKQLLENNNFLNNQNYVNSNLKSSKIYSSYLDLFNLNKFYQIAIVSNDSIKIIITFIVWYVFFILPAIIIIKGFINNNTSLIFLFIFLFFLVYTVFFKFISISMKHIDNTNWIQKYKDKISLLDLFFHTENKWFIDNWSIKLKKMPKNDLKILFQMKVIIFLLIIAIIVGNSDNPRENYQYIIVFIYLASFLFININNIIYYILYKVFSKLKYIYNLIYYYFYPDSNKVYLLNPKVNKINTILKNKNGYIYTDTAFIKDKFNKRKKKISAIMLNIIYMFIYKISKIYDIISFYIKPMKK